MLILGLIFAGSDFILYYSFKTSLMETVDNTLMDAAEEAQTAIAGSPVKKWWENIKRVERSFLVNRLFIQILEVIPNEEDNLQVVAKSGVLSGNISQKRLWEDIGQHMPGTPLYMNINVKSPSNHPLRIILYPVSHVETGGGKSNGYLIQVGSSLKKVFSTLKNFQVILMVSGPLLLLISALGGYLILTRALRPVKEVVQTARRITAEDLSLRIQSKNRKDEIGQLITTFNQMISRLERSVQQIKQFSGDASHDLKTPLTVIRGEIEIALRKDRRPEGYKKTLSTVYEEAKKLEILIDNLLFLSRIDTRDYPFLLKETPLDEIVLNVFEKLEQMAAQKKLSYMIGKMDAAVVTGDMVLLNRLVMNLLDNAVKYTPPGKTVEISLKKTKEKVQLIVRDTGIGIPPESLPYIFDRFYRVDRARTHSRGGSGLGLSIAKRIVDIHRADIKITSKIDQGTTVRVSFPL
jgi:heavy metal sensor kinase